MSEMTAAINANPVTGSGLTAQAAGSRIVSVDFMRGLAMVVMAIDHSRDFLSNLPFEPEDIAHTYPALFLTRWITHFCAPLFFFLAGTGAYLLRQRAGSVGVASRFLFTRGLWLVLLEFTIIDYAWTFVWWHFGGVIWSLGCSMVLLALLIRLPDVVTLCVGASLVLFHDLFDGVQAAQLGRFDWLWVILHRKGMVPHTEFFVLFPLVPLVGVMALGYCFGKVFSKPAEVRSLIMFRLGLGATGAFLALRAFNAYGNPAAGVARNSPGEWHVQSTVAMSVVSILDVEKYPASLQFLLMTLGLGLILFSIVERASLSPRMARWLNPIVVFGRVPLLFYVLHLFTIHLAAILLAGLTHQPADWLWHGGFFRNYKPDDYGHGLPAVYLTWFVVVALLYFPCAWFAGYRQRHRAWWLSYLE